MSKIKERQKLTPPEIARSWGISPEKVLSWIVSGELRAIDASKVRGGKPRYLIDVDDLADFESRRSVVSRPSQPERKQRDTTATEYFYRMQTPRRTRPRRQNALFPA